MIHTPLRAIDNEALSPQYMIRRTARLPQASRRTVFHCRASLVRLEAIGIRVVLPPRRCCAASASLLERHTVVFQLAAGAEPLPGYRLIEILGRGMFGEVWKAG